jgi:hypothetical protein
MQVSTSTSTVQKPVAKYASSMTIRLSRSSKLTLKDLMDTARTTKRGNLVKMTTMTNHSYLPDLFIYVSRNKSNASKTKK